MRVKNPSTGLYWYGIFNKIPVEFKSCYTKLTKSDLNYSETASAERTCIQINFPSPERSQWLNLILLNKIHIVTGFHREISILPTNLNLFNIKIIGLRFSEEPCSIH
nr:hypothetical protein [Rhynchosporium commune]AHC02377.1 hypothetical protein [Rhynchosporium commune]